MINLQCANLEGLEAFASLFIFFVVIVIIIGTVISKANKTQFTHTSNNGPFEQNPNDNGQLTEGQRRYQNELKGRKAQQQQEQHKVDNHSHIGKVETYPQIVGSLGEVNDEGCQELDGVRLIATDLMYEDGDERTFNYEKIRKSIVLGEILNTPRFKNPFGKK